MPNRMRTRPAPRQPPRQQQQNTMIVMPSVAYLLLAAAALLPTATLASSYRARHCAGTIRHVHLAVGHDPASQMTVSFSSVRSFHVPIVGGVLVGTKPDELDTYIEEQEPARYYNATPVKEYHGHYYSPLLHHIRISHLEPSTTYYYKCVVRGHLEKPPIPAALLRGGKDYADALPEEAVMRAEERDQEVEVDDEGGVWAIDDEGEEGAGRRELRQRRDLEMTYYDSTKGECPPPNKIRSFDTAPAVGTIGTKTNELSGKPALKFAYIGDIGQFDHSIETIRHLVTHQRASVSAIMLAGDIAYTSYDNRRWDTYFDFMDDAFMIDKIPMHICAGNHDIEKQEKGGDVFMAYEHRFDMPQVKPAQLGTYQGPLGYLNMDTPPYPLPYEYGNAYYAFSYGISHHIFLNAYSSMEPDSLQYQWLLQELKSIDRSQTPWLIVTIHVPVYNGFDAHRHDLQIVAAKQHLEALLVEYKVNLVVSGHIHTYQRTKNVAFGKVDPTGPVHVLVGAGGRQCKGKFLQEEPEPWLVVRDATRYGYGTLEIFNKTHAKWDWILTGFSEYQDVNKVWKTDKTLPPLKHSDSVVLENQFFLAV